MTWEKFSELVAKQTRVHVLRAIERAMNAVDSRLTDMEREHRATLVRLALAEAQIVELLAKQLEAERR